MKILLGSGYITIATTDMCTHLCVCVCVCVCVWPSKYCWLTYCNCCRMDLQLGLRLVPDTSIRPVAEYKPCCNFDAVNVESISASLQLSQLDVVHKICKTKNDFYKLFFIQLVVFLYFRFDKFISYSYCVLNKNLCTQCF